MTNTTPRRARPLLALALTLAALALRPDRAAAQTPETAVAVSDTVREIRLTDGSVLYGQVVEDRGDEIVVRTQGGTTVTLRRNQIASIRAFQGRVVNGRVWTDDPNTSRLFFGPTARSIKKGEGYLGVYELFFPFVSYGVTDRFTISGGTPIVPGAIGEFFYIAPKYEFLRAPRVSAAVGAIAAFATEEAIDGGSVGLLYGVATFGGADNSLTAGATVPFVASEEDSEIGREPAFMVGGERRLSSRTKLITENYLFPSEETALVSAGFRFFGERLSADLGLGAPVGGSNNGCCLPLVNFVYSF